MVVKRTRAILLGTTLALGLVTGGAWMHRVRAGSRVEITVTGANLRDQPGKAGRIVGKGAEGEILEVLGSEGDWVKVSRADGTRAYIHRNIVRADGLRAPDHAAPRAAPRAPTLGAATLGAPALPSRTPVKKNCHEYRLNWIASPKGILVSLRTDLPDTTPVEVCLDRQASLPDGQAQRVPYLRESTTVGALRTMRQIPIDHAAWTRRAGKLLGQAAGLSPENRIRVEVKTPSRYPDPGRSTHEVVLEGMAVRGRAVLSSGSSFPIPESVAAVR